MTKGALPTPSTEFEDEKGCKERNGGGGDEWKKLHKFDLFSQFFIIFAGTQVRYLHIFIKLL